jgi:leucyl aminopeptidase
MAGKAWADKSSSTYEKGATGFGVRLLDQYVADVLEA